jgi:hypothetical protein
MVKRTDNAMVKRTDNTIFKRTDNTMDIPHLPELLSSPW